MSDWSPVATALLGSWPSQVSAWGREALAAYIAELEARGLTPDTALGAIRVCGGRFPPSAGELTTAACGDPSAPTFTEACELIFGSGGVLRARTRVSKAVWEAGERDRLNDEAAWERAQGMHPLLAGFVQSQGLRRLRMLDMDDPEWGLARRRQLEREWNAFCEASENREVAALTAPRRGEMGRVDPLATLAAVGVGQIEGEESS